MSDEEKEFESEEEEEEESAPAPAPAAEEEEAPAEEAKPKPKAPPKQLPQEEEGDGMTEAQRAMLEAKKKHEEQEAKRETEMLAKRENERMTLDDELTALKEKLAARKAERAEEEAKIMEFRKAEEEMHRADMEAKKKEYEEKLLQKEIEKKKTGASVVLPLPITKTGKNFHLTKKEKAAKAAEEGVDTTAEDEADYEAGKQAFLEQMTKPLDMSGMDMYALHECVKALHRRHKRLEEAKYDLTNRDQVQTYELKELHEREKQKARSKALEQGLDSEEAETSHLPPKVRVASKFDRQVDKRTYVDKKDMYENPYEAPPPGLFRGTVRPPPEFGHPAVTNEELEVLKKTMAPIPGRYKEVEPIEGAKPPVEPIAGHMPEDGPVAPAAAPADAKKGAADPKAAAAPAEQKGAPAPPPKAAKPERQAPTNPFKAADKKK